ncbi:MAG TPA: DUF2520 domain-containing protein [bacterium]|jgi:predicted short-subunit dehydrogenase-like oxidoreductase (DUF2520 family)|nr:DUF2520 domain-containing protein [bacterium]HNT66326.1 DUF2520 domain-containing protein [bacterium]HOX87250.1 DUF2520 domain-containing protein [bacterium]HPG46711.1 DUF2520 domain-containing protein [bacterium]HPM98757.1 DUF2520 domain-containing protein [bacterium]
MKEAIGIIGIGRLGKSLAIALCEAGCTVVALCDIQPEKAASCAANCHEKTRPYTLHEMPIDLSLLLFAIPDDEVSPLVKQFAAIYPANPECVIAHVSGSLSSEVLAPLLPITSRLAAIHPVQTFSGAEEDWRRLFGITYGLDGDPQALIVLKDIVKRLHSRAITIAPENKHLYHLGCVLASNYLVGIESLAIEVFKRIGLDEETTITTLEPLIVSSLENIKEMGSVKALTGPVSRGDITTVVNHLRAIEKNLPELLPVYLALGERIIEIAQQQNPENADRLRNIEELFAQVRVQKLMSKINNY